MYSKLYKYSDFFLIKMYFYCLYLLLIHLEFDAVSNNLLKISNKLDIQFIIFPHCFEIQSVLDY